MSAVSSEPYQAKKLQASERNQQQNHQQIVLAFAIEIIVVITSLIGAWLMAGKYARTQAVLALMAALCLASPVQAADFSFNASKRDDGKVSALLTITGDVT